MMGMDGSSSEEPTPHGSITEPTVCRLCGASNPLCNGTGFYDKDVPVGHPDFSKVFRCPNNPPEADTNRQEVLRRISNLDAFSDKTFANFDDRQHELNHQEFDSLRGAYEICARYADNPEKRWVVLQGTYGCGKTHLAAAIGNTSLARGMMVLFTTAPDLLDHLRSTYAPDAAMGYDQTFDRVRNAEMLILDDLGVENPSEWAKEKLFQLLNYRYNAQLPTVITTNTDIDRLDPRLRSRMLDPDVVSRVEIIATDYRGSQINENSYLSDLHLYRNYQFDTFDVRSGATPDEQKNLSNALRSAQEYAQSASGWFMLLGDSGTGKTHLAAAIANYQYQQYGVEAMFVNTADLLDYLRRTFSPTSPVSFEHQFQQVRNAPLLVLDDLGAVDHNKPWVREKLLQIVKHRYVKHLPTVFTTTQQLEHLDIQLRTRLKDRRLCRIFAFIARPYVDRTNGGILR